MERTLPRTPRNRRRHLSRTAALLATLAVAVSPALLPGARADDLRDKQNQAEKGVKTAAADLEVSSKALRAAATTLRAARARLADAKQRLAVSEGQLTAARVLDRQMQTRLARAEQALAVAEAELKAGAADVKEQRAAIGRLAASNFQHGDPRLIRISMMLSGRDPVELADQLEILDNLMSREENMYDDLKATEALLVVQKDKVEKAKAVVAQKRRAAAANLTRKKKLERAAAADRAQVAALVHEHQDAAQAAVRARAADAQKLRKAKLEEARIRRLILERARYHKGGYKGASSGFLQVPVANSYITSPYGMRRHPIYGYWGLHNGTDFHAPCGVPLLASASGTVLSEYYDDVYGNRLFLDVGTVNGKSMTLVYNHLSSYRVGTGARVSRGAVVGYSGTTGWSTACHLHFTVLVDGSPVDPEKFL